MKTTNLFEYALALKITYTNYITKFYYFNNILIIFGTFYSNYIWDFSPFSPFLPFHISSIKFNYPKTLNNSNVNKVPKIPPKITSKTE